MFQEKKLDDELFETAERYLINREYVKVELFENAIIHVWMKKMIIDKSFASADLVFLIKSRKEHARILLKHLDIVDLVLGYLRKQQSSEDGVKIEHLNIDNQIDVSVFHTEKKSLTITSTFIILDTADSDKFSLAFKNGDLSFNITPLVDIGQFICGRETKIREILDKISSKHRLELKLRKIEFTQKVALLIGGIACLAALAYVIFPML
ncbi:MAG: hypothetical protein ACTSSJ_01700 [Candidatus Odinarchaeia archaeon]